MKELTFSQLEQQDPSDPIWAVNCAGESSRTLNRSGDVRIMVPSLYNGSDPDEIVIPDTWLPICLTERLNRNQLLNTSALRQAYNKGLIRFVSNADAKLLLSQEGADEEKDRIERAEFEARQAGAAKSLDATPTEIHGSKEDEEAEAEESGNQRRTEHTIDYSKTDDVEPGISFEFSTWIDKHKASSDITAMNAMRTRRKFSRAELVYAQRNFTGKPKTLARIAQILASISKSGK